MKAPKLYWSDTGLAAHLAGVGDPERLLAMPRCGAFLENLLLCHLVAWRETLAPRPEVYYSRTASGLEVDFIIEHRRRLLPVEVKAATLVRPDDVRALERFLDEHPAAAPFGLCVHTGAEPYAIARRVLAVPIHMLL